eukprot:evm.model.scf_2946.2 EVM.evm.TU.scf_2946.2   scf_2946:6198-11456(+)
MDSVWDYLTACCSALQSLQTYYFLPAQDVWINNRRFRILRQIAEGGYSFVYLAKELPTEDRATVLDAKYALKKILATTKEQLADAQREIDVLQKLRHPGVIPLLESGVVTEASAEGGSMQVVYMLFPWFKEGSAVDVVEKVHTNGRRLSPYNVVDIFRQVCEGVKHMHQQGMTHRDIKPHNVLLTHRGELDHGLDGEELIPVLEAIPENSSSSESYGLDSPGWERTFGYKAVLTDLGSVGSVKVQISNRAEAVALQEEAQALCTAPYRAPELFDVPSPTTIDDRIDTWSLGCTLYYLMYGVSPFERVLNEAGGSLALAVVNGRVHWPKPPFLQYPEEIHSIVVACLDTSPQTRPGVSQVLERVNRVLKGLPR